MPATTARKGSAAYEKGIREGRAMSAKSRTPEPEEAEEEEEEGEEEEMDMASTSRKRSAKGAKNTKAPMDGGMYGKKPMDAECGCKGKKGAKCDGNCGGSMRKRGDAALTPHEYLNACDLGIQDRSRSYIRARLDAAERLDLKCGKGSISEGEKCTKGAAQKADPSAKSGAMQGGSKVRGLKTAAKIAGAAALIGGAAYLQQTALRNTLERRSLANPASAGGVAFKAQMLKEGRTPQQIRNLREKAAMNAAARRVAPLVKRAKAAKRDSPYASGFPLDSAALAI
jgi:hypothetical protein